MKRLARRTVFAATPAFFLWLPSVIWSADVETVKTEFDIFSKGDRVGTYTMTRSRVVQGDSSSVKLEMVTAVRASFLFFKYTLDTREEAVVGAAGLLSYQRDTDDNGDLTKVAGRRTEDGFSLDITEDGENRALRVKAEQYEVTTPETVGSALKEGDPPRRSKVLDLDELILREEKNVFLRTEEVMAGDTALLCRLVSFESPVGEGVRWIAEDALGPFVAREEGEGEDGPYMFVITSYYYAVR